MSGHSSSSRSGNVPPHGHLPSPAKALQPGPSRRPKHAGAHPTRTILPIESTDIAPLKPSATPLAPPNTSAQGRSQTNPQVQSTTPTIKTTFSETTTPSLPPPITTPPTMTLPPATTLASTGTFFITPAAHSQTTTPNRRSNSGRLATILAILIPCVLLTALSIACAIIWCKRRRRTPFGDRLNHQREPSGSGVKVEVIPSPWSLVVARELEQLRAEEEERERKRLAAAEMDLDSARASYDSGFLAHRDVQDTCTMGLLTAEGIDTGRFEEISLYRTTIPSSCTSRRQTGGSGFTDRNSSGTYRLLA